LAFDVAFSTYYNFEVNGRFNVYFSSLTAVSLFVP
jgi:hypothetical protein